MVFSPDHMRPSLSHIAALLALGAALTALPGVSGSRGVVRDVSSRSAARGGSYRLDASEAILHSAEDGAPDGTLAADSGLVTDQRQHGNHPPAVMPGTAPHASPTRSPIASAQAAAGPPGSGRYLRPPGRASPLA